MFKRVRTFFNGVFRSSQKPSWMYRPLAFPGWLQTASGQNIGEDKAISWTAIWRGIQLVGCAIGSMPFTIQEEDNEGNLKTRKDHPLYNMINMEPHPFYSTFDFLFGVIYQILLRGNAVIVINRIGRASGSNRPGSLRLIQWEDVTTINEVDGVIFYQIKGYQQRVPHYDVIHIKGLTKDGVSGLDTMVWNKESFARALSSDHSVDAYYKNGTHAEGFLSTETMMNTEQRTDLQRAWNERNRSGETPFLTGGVKWNAMSVSPKDIQLLESRQFNVYEAARILGISPHLLFAMDRANFSNVETLSLEFAKYTLRFLVERIEQEFNRKIFRSSEKGRLKVSLNMDAFLRGDTETRAQYLQTLMDRGVFSIDEARQMEGYNSLENGTGGVHLVPLNFQKLEDMHNPPTEETEDNAPETDDTPIPNGRKLNGKPILN